MSAHHVSGQDEDNTPEQVDSPGRRLHVARHSKGLTLERIASELHLGVAMIQSLEQDDYDALPGDVFIVGYIRKYARVVGLDPEPLVAAYRRTAPKETRTWLLPRTTPRSQPPAGSGHPVMRIVSFGILILLAALTFIWWESQPPGDDMLPADTASEPSAILPPAIDTDIGTGKPSADVAAPRENEAQATPAPAAQTQPLSQSAQPATQPETTDAEQKSQDADSTADPAPEGRAAAQDTATAQDDAANESVDPAASPADDDAATDTEFEEIVMTFEGPCWVDVRDDERKYKLFGEMKKGDRHVLEGMPPYSVILGNASAVKITVGGVPFDLNAIAQGNVARFTLNPNEPSPDQSDSN